MFVSPDHARAPGHPYEAYLGGVAAGMRRAEAKHGIVGRIIPLIERHFGRRPPSRRQDGRAHT